MYSKYLQSLLKGQRTDGGWETKLPKIFKIVETYRHDHSLESSWGAHSDGIGLYPILSLWGEWSFSSTIARLNLVDRELFTTPKHWILLHIYHIQGVIFTKIPHLVSLWGAVYCSPDIFILKWLPTIRFSIQLYSSKESDRIEIWSVQ
jgi:hypothetical protein